MEKVEGVKDRVVEKSSEDLDKGKEIKDKAM